MDLNPTPQDEAFRQQVRQWLADNLPKKKLETIEERKEWHRKLYEAGYLGMGWPKEYGGQNARPMEQAIVGAEMARVNAPAAVNGLGIGIVGPTIIHHGTEEQKQRYIRNILTAEEIWCQLYSEPNAGSDLAGLRTRAELDGDDYVVNGQKIWTSGAAHADWGFFLVRTDKTVKPQRGISFLIIKMDTPGITVRQIPQINGEAHLCEVFLDNVEVPADQLIGEPGMGWTYAKFLLEHERTTSSFIYWSKRELARAKDIALGESVGGRRVADDPAFRARFAKAEADLLALEWSVLRVLAHEELDEPEAAAASVLKIRGSELQQEITMLQVDAMGAKSLRFFDAAPVPPPAPTDVWPDYAPGRTTVALINRAATIYGGSKQIQKNILARLAFGL